MKEARVAHPGRPQVAELTSIQIVSTPMPELLRVRLCPDVLPSRSRNLASAAALAITCVLAARAALAQSPPMSPPPPGDVDQALMLDELRPLVLRFEISAEGKGFRAHWHEYVERLFAYLDQDGDGALAGKEIARSNAWRVRLAVGQPEKPMAKPTTTPTDAATAARSAEVKVARDEWIKGLAGAGEHPQFVNQAVAVTSSQPLWVRLDCDADGKLSAEELAAAPGALGPLDTNEDEMIASEELTPYQPAPFGYAAAGGAPGAAVVVPLAPDDPARNLLVRELFRHYDRSGRGGKAANRRLEPQEVQLEPAVFGKADRDHDGTLNRTELLAWLQDPSVDATAAVNFGGGPNALAVVPVGEGLQREVRRNADGSQTVSVGRLRLDFVMAEMWPHPPDDKLLERQFRAADRDGNGELDSGECQMQPYLKDELEFLDRNSDGKLSFDEALPFFRQQDGLARCQIAITVLDQGRVLYSAMDADHDGRLSVRELRAAGSKFSLWDANGDGRLAEDEIPHQVRITIQRGMQTNAPQSQPAGPNVMRPGNIAAGRGGPRWFQRMDRNGDGDVSLREFLLAAERFRELDSDGDGLIDASEANRITQRPTPVTTQP